MNNVDKTLSSANSDMVRIKQAISFFNLSESFFRHGMMNREIPYYKFGGAVFVSVSEIEKIIAGNKIE